MLASADIPVQTIAPKFSGRFNKGVDYAGDPLLFAREFESDLLAFSIAISLSKKKYTARNEHNMIGIIRGPPLNIKAHNDKVSVVWGTPTGVTALLNVS